MYLEGPHNLEPRGDNPPEWDTDDDGIEQAGDCACCGDQFTDSGPGAQSSVDADLCEWCYTQGPDALPECFQCGEAVIPGHACAERTP